MAREIVVTRRSGLVLSLLVLGSLLTLPSPAAAEVVELPGLTYQVNASMADNLKALTGRKVRLNLLGGVSLTGNVKAVGNELLHLEKLEGKEYFDALVRISEITSFDTRFRDMQR